MKYLITLLIACCTFSLAQAEDSQMGEIKWVCVSKEKFQQLKQVIDGDEALVAVNFTCDKDGCDCENSKCCN